MTENTPLEKYQKLQSKVLYFIFLIALLSMLGSLYFSTFGDPIHNIMSRTMFQLGHGFAPCELCWFARILMYPIMPISLIGLLKDDKHFSDYVLPLSVIGIGLDIYHYSLQKFHIATIFRCTLNNPCDALQVQYFGFITIPFLAAIAFATITLLCVVNIWLNRKIKRATL